MPLFSFWYPTSAPKTEDAEVPARPDDDGGGVYDGRNDSTLASSAPDVASDAEQAVEVKPEQSLASPSNVQPEDVPLPASPDPADTPPKPRRPTRSFAYRSFSFLYGTPANHSREHSQHNNAALSASSERAKRTRASAAFARNLMPAASPDKRAKQSALIVRSLIVGPTSISPASPKPRAAASLPQLKKVKAQLMQPKTANRVIAQLRALPVSDAPVHVKGLKDVDTDEKPRGPIHGVCLAYPDAEEHQRHFAKLTEAAEVAGMAGVAGASVDALVALFKDMHIVSLVMQPDLGLGQPGDGDGILAGALPTAETVIKGIEQITPSLMGLGYATGRAVTPDHTGVYPPTDRIFVLTYWWGLEIVLPPPTLVYLSKEPSISTAVINFLTAMSMINNGVREILPFVRYISQFVDFEFKAILKQDRGAGVVCAATWIMPAAMVPRPWDFKAKPPPEDKPSNGHPISTPTDETPKLPEDRSQPPSGAVPSVPAGEPSKTDPTHAQPPADKVPNTPAEPAVPPVEPEVPSGEPPKADPVQPPVEITPSPTPGPVTNTSDPAPQITPLPVSTTV
ncbi:hypothetical protein PLICRDRAFT_172493 [Plicaturopsis crispa FD-325 SS-3]|nr:hypothetical protein PLICRDRAFT_172493 [Plicaturopsis crispa FD-325 SS-3]